MRQRTEFSTWFHGSESDWQRLSMTERETIAFTATGCAVAYPTWDAPVDCVHDTCQVRRGEIKPIRVINSTLRYERESGWLRFITDRKRLASIYRVIRNECTKNQTTDIWACWAVIVYGAVNS